MGWSKPESQIYNMKILVVDDEVDVRALFEQRFRKEIRDKVMIFAFAHSGQEALNYLSDKSRESILILSDINMPGMSGLELLKHIKDEFEKPLAHRHDDNRFRR